MGLGLEGAYGAAGAADALRQLIKDRFERERQLHAQTIQDQTLANQTRQLTQNDQYRQDQLEENKRLHDQMNADRLFKENTTLNESIQPGARFQGSNPIVGRLMPVGGVRSAGIDVAPPESLAATPGQSAELPGTIANAPSPGMREYTKVETQKQYDTRTDNEEKAAMRARQEARDVQLAKQGDASIDAKIQALTQAAERIRLQGDKTTSDILLAQARAEALRAKSETDATKAAAGPKLGQRDQDTVVVVHQMVPLIDQAIAGLKKRVKDTPPPKPGIMGALRQIPEKVERAGQAAAYNIGLGQPADISNQIQLEALMQVMGSTPYLRGSRNYEYIKQIQKHLADPSATDAANLERLQQLRQRLPEIEQAVYDVTNQGRVPHSHENRDRNAPDAAPVAAPTAAAPAATPDAAPKIGDRKTFPNGRVGVWDGQGYVPE